jgi:hypothetical protein
MDLTDAPESKTDEKSTPLNYFQIREIRIPAGGAPILDRKMRLRRLDVLPGGRIGLHDHSNCPAILFVLRGSTTIYDKSTPRRASTVNDGESVREYSPYRRRGRQRGVRRALKRRCSRYGCGLDWPARSRPQRRRQSDRRHDSRYLSQPASGRQAGWWFLIWKVRRRGVRRR